MKTFVRFLTILILATLSVPLSKAATTLTLNPLSSFGPNGDGSVKPGQSIGTSPVTGNDVQISAPATTVNGVTTQYGVQPGDSTNAPISTNGFNMRGLAADPVSGNLVFVDTHAGSGGSQTPPPNSAIYVLNRNSGQIIGVLNTNGIYAMAGSGIGPFVTAGVADDGVVYVCNQINSTANGFSIYRWSTADVGNGAFGQPAQVAFTNAITPAERMAQTMAVRGAGTNTQIILGTSGANGTTTNVYLFTTIDGTNFSSHRIFFPGITTGVFNDGIAFGPGNTFFTKQVGKPLYYLAYDPINVTNASSQGTVIASYSGVSPNDPLLNISAIAFDTTNNLLAGMEEIGGTATGGNGKLWLYRVANPTNQAPAILATRVYTVNFQKTTAPMGYLCFSNGRLYAHASNNGFLCSTVDSITLSPPSYTWTDYGLDGATITRNGDLPSTTRAASGQGAHFEVFAVADVTNYQWYSNNVAISGANALSYDIANVTTNMNGIVFKVIAYNAAGSATSANSTLQVVSVTDFFHPNLLWSFVGGATNYISSTGGTGTPNERCIAYNALSNQLLVVRGPSGTTVRIYVVNPDTGQFLYNLKTNGIFGGQNLGLAGAAVADDGAVYAANVAGNDSFRVYRWANTDSNTIPVVIWGTNSSAAQYNPTADLTGSAMNRYGDTLSVRGSGNDTEIFLDSQTPTKYVGILRPVADGTMTNWTQTGYLLQNVVGSYGSSAYGASIGRSIQPGPAMNTPFGVVPTFWQKRFNAGGSPLAAMGYTPGGGLAPLAMANVSNPLFTNAETAINFSLNIAAAVNFTAGTTASITQPDTLEFYDATDPSQTVPLTANRQNLPGANAPSGGRLQNANAIAQVIFGDNPVTGTHYVFAIEGNNGIAAYTMTGGATPAPKFLTQPKSARILQGTTASLNVSVDQLSTLAWYKAGVDTGVRGTAFSITNAQPSAAGSYFVIATNVNGSVTSTVASVTIALTNDVYTLSQVWAANPTNSGSFPYVSTDGGANTPNERSFAYNALSNQLVIVRCPPASTVYAITVVDANTGAKLYQMDTTAVVHQGNSEVAGQNPIDLVGAACSADGSLYVASESPNASGGANGDTTKMLKVYRWANTASNTVATVVYQGDPSGQPAGVNLRWGDVVAARGSGINTELLLNANDGAFAAVLKPNDGTLTAFTNTWFSDLAGGGSIGRSLQFGTNATLLEKRKGSTLAFSSYNLAGNSSSQLVSYDSTLTLGGVAVDLARNLAIGVDFVGSGTKPDAVAIYDVSIPATPMLVNRYNFPNNQVANNNFICQTIIVGNRVYSLNANNGLVAFNIVPPANSLTLSITPSGSNVNLSWGSSQAILQGTPSLSSPNWTDLTSLGATNSVQPAAGTNTFYRLRL